jgi:peptidylprolyl isomerase
MAAAQEQNKVKVHYTGKLASGEVFDTSAERGPLEFTVGEGRIIPGFEQAVVGMTPGESKAVTIPAEQAYGPHRDDRVFDVPKANLPDDVDAEVGQKLEVRHPDGAKTVVTVSEVGPENVKLDANHPLAGQDLTFDIELVAVE